MYTFEHYLTLSRRTKSLATRYWCACLKAHLNAKSAYEMKRKLLNEKEWGNKDNDWLNKSSRFFNKKEAGEPVIRYDVINQIDKRINGDFCSFAILCHPLWQLLDNKQPTDTFINQVLSQLPYNYACLLFKENSHGQLIRKTKLTQKAKQKLTHSHDIHALTCWLAFCLEKKTVGYNQIDINQLCAIQHLLKMAIVTPFSSVTDDFYVYVNEVFSPLYSRMPVMRYRILIPNENNGYTDFSLPMRLISGNCLTLHPTLGLYKKLCDRAIKIGLVANSFDGMNRFYNFICHSEIVELMNLLFQPTPPTSLKTLKQQILYRLIYCK